MTSEVANCVNPARRKILLVTRNLPPLLGGMERLNLHLALELAKAFDVDVVGPTGCRAQLSVASNVEEISPRPLWRFLIVACVRALRLARKRCPNYILAGSGLTATIAFIAVAYVHGLDLVAAHLA